MPYECDICKVEFPSSKPNPAKYDGKTVHGPWAYMCSTHFKSVGTGLGMGRGSKLAS